MINFPAVIHEDSCTRTLQSLTLKKKQTNSQSVEKKSL